VDVRAHETRSENTEMSFSRAFAQRLRVPADISTLYFFKVRLSVVVIWVFKTRRTAREIVVRTEAQFHMCLQERMQIIWLVIMSRGECN
jgi:hypothetical protein